MTALRLLSRFLRRILRMLGLLRHLQGAVWLNLEPRMASVVVGGTLNFAIRPVTADKQPAPVTDIVWSVEGGLSFHVADDNMSVALAASAVGPAKLTVTAKSVGGAVLTSSADIDVQADQEAVDLGLVQV